MRRISLPELAHRQCSEHLPFGGLALDATVGNGHDTLFLAQQVGTRGRVFGFDVQFSAIEATRQRLSEAGMSDHVILQQASHTNMATLTPSHLHGSFTVIMFNLGYLPGGDKTIITRTDETLAALDSAINLLSPKGLLSVLAYPGHPGGNEETDAVQCWLQSLAPTKFHSQIVFGHTRSAKAPRLLLVRKNK